MMRQTMKTDKWYLKVIVVFYRILMPLVIIFLFFIAPQILYFQELGFEKNNPILKIILCLLFCIAYAFVPYVSSGFYYYRFPDFQKSNLVISPKSKILSSIMIMGRFIAFFVMTAFVLESYMPVFGKYNFMLAGVNSLILTIPAVAQYFALNE
jgi:hypothetical protein